MNHARSRVTGFSLLELILSISMAAMLMLSLYSTMNVAVKARRSAIAAVTPARAGSIAMDIIRGDLDNVVPPPSSTATTTFLAGPFVGTHQGGGYADADDLIFYTLGADEAEVMRPRDEGQQQLQSPSSRGLLGTGSDQPTISPFAEGVRMVEYVLRSDVNPPVLVRRVTRNLLAPIQADPEEQILCRNVRSFGVHYYDGAAWQPEWDSTELGDVLPMTVEVLIDVVDSPTADGPIRRIYDVFPIPCAKPQPDTTTTGATATP